MAQAGSALEDGFQDSGWAVTVPDVGGMDDHTDHQTQRIDDDMALAAHDLLARIKAPYSSTFGGLDRLAIDDASAGKGLAAFPFSIRQDQNVADGT